MKIVIQRVSKASVKVENEIVGKIDKGLFVLIGIKDGDTKDNAEGLAEKISKMRIMADGSGKMNLSVLDTGSPILAVSQFTLYAETKKGNRPSFIKAGDPKEAEEIYKHFIAHLVNKGIKVETGRFGSYMDISANLDGPVTITLENE